MSTFLVQDAERSALPEAAGAPCAPLRAIVADDDQGSRDLLSYLLQKWGFEVCLASDGTEAWELLRSSDRPTIVILDWMMPGVEGTELCSRARQLARNHYLYILLLSGKNQTQDILEGLRAGADDYLVKPLDPAILGARLFVARRIADFHERLTATQGLLARSEERYRSLVENTPAFICTHDLEGNVLSINPAAAQSLGFTAEQCIGRNVQEALAPEARANFGLYLSEIREKQVSSGNMALISRSGQRVVWFYVNRLVEGTKGSYVLGNAQDVTERIELQRALRVSEERYRNLVEDTSAFICTHDLEGRILSINQPAACSLGYSVVECVGKNIKELLAPEVRADYPVFIGQLQQQRVASGRMAVISRDGQRAVWSYTSRLVQGKVPYVIGNAQDITERVRMQQSEQRNQELLLEMERKLSRTDALTGLANRRAFYERAEVERRRAVRYQRMLSMAYIDLDNFKRVNDERGHEEGDRVLVCVAGVLQTSVRAETIMARMGGDELALLLPETNHDGAMQMLTKLQGQLVQAMQERGWPVTFSVGLVTFQEPPATIDDMTRAADQVMYEVKRQGKNRIGSRVERK